MTVMCWLCCDCVVSKLGLQGEYENTRTLLAKINNAASASSPPDLPEEDDTASYENWSAVK